MTEISATEAARNFADLLDSVEREREQFVILRRGRPVAKLGPSPKSRLPDIVTRLREGSRRHRTERDQRSSTNQEQTARSFGELETLLRPDVEKEPLLRQLLAELEDAGCDLKPPGGIHRRDYVSATPHGNRARIVSIHAATGRAEFQTDSWSRVGHMSARFVRLAAGNKAAHPLDDAEDLRAIIDAARYELRSRGLQGTPAP